MNLIHRLIAGSVTAAVVWATPAAAQTLTRRAVDLSALIAYPGFYHAQPVVLRAELVQTGETTALVRPDEPRAIRIVAAGAATPEGRVEARGVFWDVGRLQPDDPRALSLGLQAIVGSDPEIQWPRPGELLALQLTDAFPVDRISTPSLRDLVLDATESVGREVTVTGQFRGRNLFGDLPQAPGLSRWDFVLKAADAALWVTGERPRGRGFDLNINARIDTNRWLQVTGTVRHSGGLVWLESATLSAAEPPAEPIAVELTPHQIGPAPVVVFSTPTPGEFDVALGTAVRLQFSRDMDPDSFTDRIQLTYADAPGVSPQAFTSTYDAATRSVAIQFAEPVPSEAAFREVTVDLLAGIQARDGAALEPWTLKFEYGGN
jgi:hypothetical protein